MVIPHGINEAFLEGMLSRIQSAGRSDDAIYWLPLARLTEAARANAIAFLAAWQLAANEQHRFDETWFWLLGRRIRQAQSLSALGTCEGDSSPMADREAMCCLAQRN